MIRTTYQGRNIKVLAARGKPHHRKMVINGYTVNYAWQGDDAQALNWFKQIIDQMDAAGGPGVSAARLHYTAPHWWAPGTFDVNPNGCATQPGGFCLCTRCVIGDPCGDKARFAPLHPDACQHCHQLADDHDDDVHLEWHAYTTPTEVQRAGRQAFIDEYMTPDTDEDDEPEPCPADHVDNRGFRWPAKASS